MAVFSGGGFGWAAYHASGNDLVGINVFIGAMCFILALVSGIHLSIQDGKER